MISDLVIRLEGRFGDRLAAALLAAAAAALTPVPERAVLAAESAPPAAAASAPMDHVIAARWSVWEKSARKGVRPRVLGGEPADPDEWPWQVALLGTKALDVYDKSSAKEVSRHANMLAQFCGGSLVAKTWVVTAAHCVAEVKPEEVKVLVGTHTLLEGTRIEVAKIVVHADYAFPNNDIALLQLKAAAFTGPSKSVKSVTLATGEMEDRHARAGTKATVTGWGLTGIGQQPKELMESEIEVHDRASCNANHLKQFHDGNAQTLASYLSEIQGLLNIPDAVVKDVSETILTNARGPYSETMICAGSPSGERDSCNGDSGGPLVVKRPDGQFMQIGIVSGGFSPPDPDKHDKPVDCGAAKTFAYYTRVSRYVDWIKRSMK